MNPVLITMHGKMSMNFTDGADFTLVILDALKNIF